MFSMVKKEKDVVEYGPCVWRTVRDIRAWMINLGFSRLYLDYLHILLWNKLSMQNRNLENISLVLTAAGE